MSSKLVGSSDDSADGGGGTGTRTKVTKLLEGGQRERDASGRPVRDEALADGLDDEKQNADTVADWNISDDGSALVDLATDLHTYNYDENWPMVDILLVKTPEFAEAADEETGDQVVCAGKNGNVPIGLLRLSGEAVDRVTVQTPLACFPPAVLRTDMHGNKLAIAFKHQCKLAAVDALTMQYPQAAAILIGGGRSPMFLAAFQHNADDRTIYGLLHHSSQHLATSVDKTMEILPIRIVTQHGHPHFIARNLLKEDILVDLKEKVRTKLLPHHCYSWNHIVSNPNDIVTNPNDMFDQIMSKTPQQCSELQVRSLAHVEGIALASTASVREHEPRIMLLLFNAQDGVHQRIADVNPISGAQIFSVLMHEPPADGQSGAFTVLNEDKANGDSHGGAAVRNGIEEWHGTEEGFSAVGAFLGGSVKRLGTSDMLLLQKFGDTKLSFVPEASSWMIALHKFPVFLGQLFQRSEYGAARPPYADALCVRRLTCGPRRVNVATATFLIGKAYHQSGRSAEAMECYKLSAAIVRATFGCNHRYLIKVTTCMGDIHHEDKRYVEAGASYSEALLVTRAALGPDHVVASILKDKITRLYEDCPDPDAYLELLCQIMQNKILVLGPRHPSIVAFMTDIANCYCLQGKYGKAHGLYVRALAAQRANLGPDHSTVADTLKNIGYVLCESGDHFGSLKAYRECLRIQREAAAVICSEGNLEIATTLTMVALVLAKKEDMATEVPLEFLWEGALLVRESKDKLDIASVLTEIAMKLYRLDVQDTVLEVLLELYPIWKQLQGHSSSDAERSYDGMGRTLFAIAGIHYKRGMYEVALRYYSLTARVQQSSLGNDRQKFAITLMQMGLTYYQVGDYDSAVRLYRQVLRISQECLGSNHWVCARFWNNIGDAEMQRGNAEPMMEAFSEASRIYRALGMSDDNLMLSGVRLYRFEVVHPNAAGAA